MASLLDRSLIEKELIDGDVRVILVKGSVYRVKNDEISLITSNVKSIEYGHTHFDFYKNDGHLYVYAVKPGFATGYTGVYPKGKL